MHGVAKETLVGAMAQPHLAGNRTPGFFCKESVSAEPRNREGQQKVNGHGMA
jgi:hypothetical protein